MGEETMEMIITLCYAGIMLIGVAAAAIQIAIRGKNLNISNDCLKGRTTTEFFILSVMQGTVDFLLYFFYFFEIHFAENLLYLIQTVLLALLVFKFIEFEGELLQGVRSVLVRRVFFVILALDVLLEFFVILRSFPVTDRIYYGLYLLINLPCWLLALWVCIRYIRNYLKAGSGISNRFRVILIAYNTAFLLLYLDNISTSIHYMGGGGYFYKEDWMSIIIWTILSCTNLHFIYNSLPDKKDIGLKLDAAVKEYGLSDREREIAELLLEGKSNQEIADILNLAESTIKTHNYRLYKKMDVESRVQAVNKIQMTK